MLSLATAAAMAAPTSEGWYGAGAQFGAASSLTPSSHMRGMPPPLAMPTASDLPSASTQGWSGLKKDKEDVEPMSCGMLYYVHVPKTGGSTVFDRLQKVGWGYNRLYWGDDGPAEENKWVANPNRWKNSSGWKWAQKMLATKKPKIILEAHHGAPGLEYMVNNVLGDVACALKAKGCQLRVVTVLRSPVERMASTLTFNEHGMPNKTRADSLLAQGADEQTRYLLKGHVKQWTNPTWHTLPSPKSIDEEVVSRAQNALSYAYLVGNSRRLDEFMGQVYTLLGVDKPADEPKALNITPDDAEVPKELKGDLWRATQSDRSLFSSWMGVAKRPRPFKDLCKAKQQATQQATPSPSPTAASAQAGKAEADAPAPTLRWSLANKTECPAGQRNAAEDECLPAAQEAAASVGLELQGPMRWVNDGPSTVVPSGCSYSRVSKSALFNYNLAGAKQVKGTPHHDAAYPLVCIDDPEFAAVSVIRNGDEKAQRSAQGKGQSCGGCLRKQCVRTLFSDPAACLSCSREQCATPVCMPEARHQHCGAKDLKATHDWPRLARASPSPLPKPITGTHAVAADGCKSVNEAVSDYWCQTNCWTWETAGDVRGGPSNGGQCPATMCKCDEKQEKKAHAQKEADSNPVTSSPEPAQDSEKDGEQAGGEQAGGEQAGETVCKSLVASATDEWCDENCASDPTAQWCAPACNCPGAVKTETEPSLNLGFARHASANHGMTEGVDPGVLEWIGDEELPPPEENPQTAHTFMPSMYTNPYLEKLEKARANGEPDPSPLPTAATAAEAKAEAEKEEYLTPKDATTCVSNNPRSIDSWCRDMCGAGVCTAEMCVCDGEAGAEAGADADSSPSPAPAPAAAAAAAAATAAANAAAANGVADAAQEAQKLAAANKARQAAKELAATAAAAVAAAAAAEAEADKLEGVTAIKPMEMTRLESEPADEGTHGMTKGVDESVLEWIGDEELPPPEENPQTAHTFMPSMYSNPYLEKLEKARANGEPDPSPLPTHNPNEADTEEYLTPKDVATCVSNNPRSIDSWCRDMCGAGVCTAEMCVCDGEDAAANGTKATDLLWVPQVPSSAQAVDLDDFGESYPDRNVRDDVPSDVPVEVIGPEMPVEEPMSQWDKSLAGDVPVGIVADASPSPRPLSDFDSWHGDIFEQQSDEQRAAEQAEQAPEPSPAPVASPTPKKPKALDTSAGPLGGGMPSGIPKPVIADETFVTPIDPRTCVSMSESATDDWCVDACDAGMCSAQMCKCDEDASIVLAQREPLAKGQLPPNAEPSHMHTGSYESLTRRTANFIAPSSKSPNQQQAVREVALVTGPAQAAAAHLDTPNVDILD
jgi:hypothetical protein